MTMGKGGVGKTTVAAAVAVALAQRGHEVTLTTTDPAAHVAGVLPDPPDNLTVTRIDPAAETAAYTRAVLADAGSELDASGYALLEEDLRSPCTEEVAVFYAFARTVAQGRDLSLIHISSLEAVQMCVRRRPRDGCRKAGRGGHARVFETEA